MKKKFVISIIVCLTAISFIGCNNSTEPQNQTEDITKKDEQEPEIPTTSLATENFKKYFFIYDTSWRTQLSENGNFFYLYPTENNSDGLIMIGYESASVGSKEANIEIFAENMTSSDSIVEVERNYETDVLGTYARNVKYTQLINDSEYTNDSYLIADGDRGVLSVTLCVPSDSSADYTDGFFKVLYSIDRFLNEYGDYPDDSIDKIDEEVENDIDYFSISLIFSDEWDTLGYSEQCDLAETCIEYCTDRATAYELTQSNINILAYRSDGYNAFSYNGGNEVRIYKDGKYDCNYYLK